jgi:hypothetical protein
MSPRTLISSGAGLADPRMLIEIEVTDLRPAD